MKTGCEVGNCGTPRLKDGWRPGGMPARVTAYLPALTAVSENQLPTLTKCASVLIIVKTLFFSAIRFSK
jgi:hypothetical protein